MASKKKKSRESKTSAARRLTAARRQLEALELKMQGVSYRAIARRMGYSGPSGSHRAVTAALTTGIETPREELRQLELMRLDKLQILPWKMATVAGDLDAVSSVLKIMKRRAALLGLDAPIEYTLQDIQEIARTFYLIVTELVEDEDLRLRIFEALEEAAD